MSRCDVDLLHLLCNVYLQRRSRESPLRSFTMILEGSFAVFTLDLWLKAAEYI